MRDSKHILKKAIGKLNQVGKYYLCRHHPEENMMEVIVDNTKSYFFNNYDFCTFFKRGWSEWSPFAFSIPGPHPVVCRGEQRNDGRKIQMRYKLNDKFIRGEATCHSVDKFDYMKGINLAKERLIKNIAKQGIANWTDIYMTQQKKIDEYLKTL